MAPCSKTISVPLDNETASWQDQDIQASASAVTSSTFDNLPLSSTVATLASHPNNGTRNSFGDSVDACSSNSNNMTIMNESTIFEELAKAVETKNGIVAMPCSAIDSCAVQTKDHGHPSDSDFVFDYKRNETNEQQQEVVSAPVLTQRHASSVVSTEPFDSNYVLGQQLGAGAFSIVREARHQATGIQYAVKIIDTKHLTNAQLLNIDNEIDILTRLRGHANIVSMVEVFYQANVDDCCYYLVLEKMMQGDLLDQIVKKETYSELEARDAMVSALRAIQYCHEHDIAHRDVKPENLLLMHHPNSNNNEYVLKLTDFGFAKRQTHFNSLTTCCGSPGYVAPEVIDEEQDGYNVGVDLWSLGVVLFILLGGYAPFDDSDPLDQYEQILEGDYEFDAVYWDEVSASAKHLIASLLTVDPTERLSAAQALQSPWITTVNTELGDHDLSSSLAVLREFNLRRKFRAAIATVRATNRLHRMVRKAKSARNNGANDKVL